jgi:hypothetical protein
MDTDIAAGNAEFALIDRMTLEHRMAQERYRFHEVLMLAAVAVISLVVVLSFMRNNLSCQPRDMVNATGLMLIIFSTIIVILLADAAVQLPRRWGYSERACQALSKIHYSGVRQWDRGTCSICPFFCPT